MKLDALVAVAAPVDLLKAMVGTAQDLVVFVGGNDPAIRLAGKFPALTEAVHAALQEFTKGGKGVDSFDGDFGRTGFTSTRVGRGLLDAVVFELDLGLHIVSLSGTTNFIKLNRTCK